MISSSPDDVQPVFDTVAERAARICEAQFVSIIVVHDDAMRQAASFGNLIGLGTDETVPLDRTTVMGRSICDGKPLHIADALAVGDDFPGGRLLAIRFGHRTVLAVPLLREGRALGTILVRRTEVRPFEDKHIDLLKTFADQAAIAIENTRLLNELRQRTRDLGESLQQQTATADILKVISGSPGKIEPVFDKILASARQLCDAKFGHLLLFDGEMWRAEALHNLPEAYARFWKATPVVAAPETNLGRVQRSGKPDQVADVRLASGYLARTALGVATVELGGARTLLTVPLLKEGKVIGGIAFYRTEVRPFDAKQIELLSSFADQAVIAIENARLFEAEQARTRELTESLQQQTATADVLKVISRSTFDLQMVLNTLVESATRLCEADRDILFRREDELYKSAAHHGYSREFQQFHDSHPITPGRGTAVGRAVLERKAVNIPDVLADPGYTFLEAQKLGRYRANLAVPLLREGEPVGALSLTRAEPRPFTDKQIELVETFADQAVIAIENVRLFNETEEALERQTADRRDIEGNRLFAIGRAAGVRGNRVEFQSVSGRLHDGGAACDWR